MYLPTHFEETRAEQLRSFIEAHPLGALVVNGPNGLDANHLPFLCEASDAAPVRLLAHVARGNAVWREVPSGSSVLVIFGTGGAYISPNWYPSKNETHEQRTRSRPGVMAERRRPCAMLDADRASQGERAGLGSA